MSNFTNNVTMKSRRDFLRTSGIGAAGLLLSVTWPGGVILGAQEQQGRGRGALPLPPPNAYLHIGTDDVVTFQITKAEMGQGTVTSLAMLLAEELDCDWQ